MSPWLIIDIAIFCCVATLTGIIIPKILLIAFRKNLFDEIDPRKIHKGAVPRLGGISFFPAILFSIFLVFGISIALNNTPVINEFEDALMAICFIVCAIVILYLIGIADDLIGIKYRAKFIAQIFSALLLCLGGLILNNLHGFCFVYTLPTPVAVIFTVLIAVFITNAINLIDGIDGLASGLSGIACVFYAIICYDSGLYVYSALAIATLGALIPFFVYNVFGDPKRRKKIFMGDTGALTIGLLLSIFAIRVCQLPNGVEYNNPAILAFAPLLIPGFDVVRVYLHRIRARRSPFMPDKSHIHHKLLALGIHQRVAMPIIIAGSAVLIVLNWILSSYVNITLLFLIDLGTWTIANIFLTKAIRKREKQIGQKLYE